MYASQEAGADPDRQQRRYADPKAERASEFDVASTHQAGDMEKQKKSKTDDASEDRVGPSDAERLCIHDKSPDCSRCAPKHEPVGDAALSRVINRDQQ